MREYEITYIASPQLTDEERAELDSAIDQLLSAAGGSITHTDATARRRLFYPVKKQATAFARTTYLSLAPDQVENVRQALKKQEGVLRVSLLQAVRKPDVTSAIFDELDGAPTAKVVPKAKKEPAREVTMEEVEDKIEKALEEEVK